MDELLGRIFADDHSQIYIGYFMVLLFFLAARLKGARKALLIPLALLVTVAWMVIENARLPDDWQYLFFAVLLMVGAALGVRYYRRMHDE